MLAHNVPNRRAQRGIALLVLLVFLVMVALAVLVGQATHVADATHARAGLTSAALAQAKEALIGRAAGDVNRPGSLPCPDRVTTVSNNVPGDGIADLLVGYDCPAYIGLLPWRTLGLPELRDSAGERLWYALSRSLRDDDSAVPINDTTYCSLTSGATDQIAAIVIASGAPLPGQAARPSIRPADYLDGSNADGDSHFSTGPAAANFNDRVLAITRDELFHAVKRRVLNQLRGTGSPPTNGLLKYANEVGEFPWADTDGDGEQNPLQPIGAVPSTGLNIPSWIGNNDWLARVNYEVGAARADISMRIDAMSVTCTLASCS